ncbi:hypothetical protein N9H45_03400 [Opitutales bacterium]|nr:hypothetical protein [Opitutales bacterium]
MSLFFKIGLPWAISLGIIFFVGLELGSDPDPFSGNTLPLNSNENDYPKNAFHNNEASKKLNSSGNNTLNQIAELGNGYPQVNYSPPLPPNLRKIMEDGSMVEKMGAYMDALRSMDENTLGLVVDAFEALPKGYGRHLEMKLLMRSWANFDPIGALQYAENSLDEKSERRFAMTEVLAGWASVDSRSAISWVKQNQEENPDSKQSGNLMVGVVKGLAENDLSSADSFFQTLPEGSAKWQASTFLAQEYVKLGTEEAILWAEKFPEEDERMKVTILGQIGSKLAQIDLEGTALWAESMPVGKASEQVMDNLLSRWTSKNPMEAANWASQLGDSEKKIQAMKSLTNKWSMRDPVATGSWLNTFPPSPELDPVVGEFVNRISSRDPEGAVGWASSILDKEQKQNAIGQALRAWDRKDPKQANAWRMQNGIEPISID